MKSFLLSVLAIILFSPAISFAHGDKFEMTADAVVAVYPVFKKDHAAELVNFAGAKGWPDQDKIQVKVYLANNTSIGYTCMMMPDGTMMCTQAP